MLVIRRGEGESVWIGDSIEVRILEVGATQVKVGISAPREVTVLRDEIARTIEANRASALPPGRSSP